MLWGVFSHERKRKWARELAGYIHELHRIRIPLTQRQLLPLNVKVLESHLLAIHAAFAAHNATFWLRDGTALGACRDGELITYDDDIDLGFWAHDEAAVERAVAELERQGFFVYLRNKNLIALLKDWETVELIRSGVPDVDPDFDAVLDGFFRELKPLPFLGRQFNVPARTEEYLEFCYGADWRIPRARAWWSNASFLPAGERATLTAKFLGRKKSGAAD